MFFLLVYMIVFPMLFIAVFENFIQDISAPMLNVVITLNTFLVPAALYCLMTGISIKDIIPHKLIDAPDIILIILISIMMIFYSFFLGSIADIFTSNTVGESISAETTQNSFAVMAFSVAVVPAIIEEIVFRGVILSGFKGAGAFKAIFLSGLYFGIMHLNFYQLFYAFPMGIILAILVYYSESIFASILSHFVINFSQIAFSYMLMPYVSQNEEYIQEAAAVSSLSDKLLMCLVNIPLCVIITPFFIIALKTFIRRHKNERSYSLNYGIWHESIFDIYFILIFVFYICYIIFEQVMMKGLI